MVRANINAGDTFKLRDTGNVSTMRRRSMRHEQMQDITGK